jgi:arginase
MDLGADRRGVDMGPYAIRYAGLEHDLLELGLEIRDHHNISVPGPENTDVGNRRAKYLPQIETACQELRTLVAGIVRDGHFPLVLGGDHSIAIGTLAGLARAGRRAGVVYVDAHPDINTASTSPSGNVHGMPLAVALGLDGDPFPAALRGTIDGSATALVAIRDVDAGERENIKKAGVTALTMADIDRMGVAAAMEKAIAVASKGDGGIHLSLDMDALDPNEAPGVGTPVRGGLTYREAQLAMEMLAASGKLRSIEVAEVNPVLDTGNRTASLAVELIASALGETIL